MLLAAVLSAVACASALAEENWSRFRGPNGRGLAAGVDFPATWTADDYAWNVPLNGKGHSSPVGWGNQLFVTTADSVTGELAVTAINAQTGKTVWEKRFTSAPHHLHAANSYASSTPAVDGAHLYVTWASPQSLKIVALTHAGQQAWQRDLGPIDYKHGFGGSPIVVDNLVIVASDNLSESFIVALDAATGEPRWRKKRTPGTESYATPVVRQADDGARQLIVHSTEEGMAGLSLADGSTLWQLNDVFPARCVSSPLVAGGLVLGGSGEGGSGKSFTAVKPPVSPGEKATIHYELKKNLPQVPTPVASADLLFVWADRGVVSCYDLATGEQHWIKRVDGNFFGSPIIAGGKLYCIEADGDVVVLAADKQYKLLGRNSLGEASHATPIVHGDNMYLRTETTLFCLPASK